MRMVVLAGAVVDLTARVTALELNCRVPDREAIAQATFEVADNMFGVS